MDQANRLVNFDFLKGFSGNDSAFMREVIEIYIDETPQYLEALHLAVQRQDWAKVGEVAHSLKSSVRFMGMGSVTEQVLQLEIFGKKQEQTARIPDLAKQVTENCLKSIEELKPLLASDI